MELYGDGIGCNSKDMELAPLELSQWKPCSRNGVSSEVEETVCRVALEKSAWRAKEGS